MDTKVKAQFFAQYYFQKVLCTKSERFNPVYLTAQSLEFRILSDFTTDYLLLRTVEQLTNEEAIVIADLLYHSKAFTKNAVITRSSDYWKYITLKNKEGFLSIGEDKITVNFNTNMSLDSRFGVNVVDYVRSIGILLPLTYLDENQKPVTLQPDEIVAKGWARTTPLPIKK